MNKWNILVVDDDSFNREIIAEYLEDGPYRITMAAHGLEAWRQLEKSGNPIDLVILDRMMPVMDGMELLRRMRSSPRHAETIVIMQTAASAHDQIREGLNAGCYYYLTKPYQQTTLLCTVHAALEQRQQEMLLKGTALQPPPIPATENAEYRFSTLEEAQRLAMLFAAQCPVPATAAVGLTELMINAIEHGNLGISYDVKSQLKRDDLWDAEISRRLSLPEYHGRLATASFVRHTDEIVFTIADQGKGFDWRKYLDFDPERAFDPNGRGIAMAGKLSFSSLEYQGNGNRVVASVKLTH